MLTTETKVKKYLGLTTLPSPLITADINIYAEAITKYIEDYCGREFETSVATSKVYDGQGTKEITIDDLYALTKIETLDEDGDVENTLDDSSEYYLYPENTTNKNLIKINTSNSPISIFPKGNQNVKVTASFGYSATVPEIISLAATKLVAGIISEQYLSDAGSVKKEKLGHYEIEYQDIDKLVNSLGIDKILDQYRLIGV